MADHYITDLEEQNEILRKAVQGIARECDNTNETHETIWRIAYSALQECGVDMVDASENTLPIHSVVGSTCMYCGKTLTHTICDNCNKPNF